MPNNQTPKGLKAVAAVEFAKGSSALVAGIWFLLKLGDDWGNAAQSLLNKYSPSASLSDRWIRFFELFDRRYQIVVASGLIVYACLHVVEAIGLWHHRHWAEGLGVISGGVYIPFEIYELVFHPSWIAGAIFCINLAVVAYLLAIIKANPAKLA